MDKKSRSNISVHRLLLAHIVEGYAANVPKALRSKFDKKSDRMISPHVTVAGPYETTQSSEEIVSLVQPILWSTDKVPLVYSGIGTFLPKTPTVFVQVQPYEWLCEFHVALVNELGWRDQYAFHPHLTLAEYVNSDRAKNIYDELVEQPIEISDYMEGITLLTRSGSSWVTLRQLPFGPT